ncbi:MAG: hypothetical protein K2N12_06560 [Helicobacter sp.]|nr:hypothetical protein [Helicobacter sp.]
MKIDSSFSTPQQTTVKETTKPKEQLENDTEGAEGAWFAQLLANLENKSLDQISERLKDTPNYLEQIAFEREQKGTKDPAPLYAVNGAQNHLEKILEQVQIRNKKHEN